MDYVEAFKNLRTNNKYGRKSPHKAILMLTVIEMFERNILIENEIYYDEQLKSIFLKVWNKVLLDEPLFHPGAYLPFWYLQNDSFWHIVPNRGKEDILILMRDTNIKPSEAKLNECVKYAELDEDLYFLMTIASGRSSLKRALLETYTRLSEEQIDMLAGSTDNVVDHSLSAMNEYEKIISSKNNDEKEFDYESSTELVKQFKELDDNLQITLSYEYFAFLKSHRSEREMLREVYPDVYTLYDRIVNHPLQREDISPSNAFVYDNFLSDLKIALMSENESMDLIDKIEVAIGILRSNDVSDDIPETMRQNDDTGVIEESISIKNAISLLNDSPEKEEETESRKGKTWTQEDEERIVLYFERGISTADIAERFGCTEGAIKVQLVKLGLIEYSCGQDVSDVITVNGMYATSDDFLIENVQARASILNKNGEKVFIADGKLKSINGKIYRLNLKKECFTIKDMRFNGEVWMKGNKKIVAYPQTMLYIIMDRAIDYCDEIEDIDDSPVFKECRLKVRGKWYNYKGEQETESTVNTEGPNNSSLSDSDKQRIVGHPLYAVRKQAVLRAMSYFRLPAKIKDITRTINKTVWGSVIKEDDVKEIISTLKEIENIEDKFILRKE